MQSWGARSRFGERDTEREPTKSGVIGLICAALGRPREATLDDLAALRLGVRADREGALECDFQTAVEVRKSNPSAPHDTATSKRYYLADAVFLVGLEGDDVSLLERIDTALGDPHWPVALGRKAFLPGEPIRLPDGLRRDTGLEEALTAYPMLPLREASGGQAPGPAAALRVQFECGPDETGESRQDVPISFLSETRRFAVRKVRYAEVPRPVSGNAGGVSHVPE